MPIETHRRSSIRLPSDMVLTACSMVAFATRLTTAEVADLIEALIAQLNKRTGDAPPPFLNLPELREALQPLCLSHRGWEIGTDPVGDVARLGTDNS